MLATFAEVERALYRYNDIVRPAGGSVAVAGGGRPDPSRLPFPPALIDDLEIREELRRRLGWLDQTDRRVVLHWYVECAAPRDIARSLRCSVRTVYRLRSAAVHRLVELGDAGEFADADVSEFV